MSDDSALSPESGSAETPEDFGKDAKAIVTRYMTEISIYDRAMKPWVDNVKKIVQRYRNDQALSGTPQGGASLDFRRKYALLWATIQTQTPALFAHSPTPIVERRWKDVDDPTATQAAEILNRALVYTLDQSAFHSSVEGSVFDYQIAGRGVIWLRKEIDEGEALTSEANDPESEDETVREILDERICIDEVPWSEFGHTLARNWTEVTLVWRRLFMSRDQLVKRFGAIGNSVELDHTPTSAPDSKDDLPPHLYKLATVYELWDRTTLKATWIAPGYKDGPLDQQDDPLRIRNFFPCPRPIFSSLDTTSLIPIPDYDMWKDQALEVDDLTGRLQALIRACKVIGVYDARCSDLARLLSEGLETDMFPVEQWTEFAQGGGFGGAVSFLPLKEIIEAISTLYEAREQAKKDAAEISGIGDILRGQNAGPEQTATEARITGQFGTLRLRDRQMEIQRFCRDIIRMMGELIAEGFTPETLEQMTGVKLPTALEKKQAQGIVDQDAAYKAYQKQQAQQQPPPGPPGAPPAAPEMAQAA